MRKIIALILTFVLLGLSGAAGAGELPDVTGTWYGYDMDGQAYIFRIEPDGTCSMQKYGFDRVYKGKWTNNSRLLTLTVNSEKYYLVSEGDHLIMDTQNSMFAYDDGIFTREPFEPFEAVIRKDAPKEDYEGTWELVYTYHYEPSYQGLYDDRHKAWYEKEGIILYYDNTKYVTIRNEELSWSDTDRKKHSPPDTMTWENGSYECPTVFHTYKINILENGNLIMDNMSYESFIFVRTDGT